MPWRYRASRIKCARCSIPRMEITVLVRREVSRQFDMKHICDAHTFFNMSVASSIIIFALVRITDGLTHSHNFLTSIFDSGMSRQVPRLLRTGGHGRPLFIMPNCNRFLLPCNSTSILCQYHKQVKYRGMETYLEYLCRG